MILKALGNAFRKLNRKKEDLTHKDNYDQTVTRCCVCSGMTTRYIDPNLKETKKTGIYRYSS